MPMVDNAVRMVLLPRYTTVYGASALYLAPFNVRRFAKVVLTAWAGRGIGTSAPAATIYVEQSADLDRWWTAGSVNPNPSSEKTTEFDLLGFEWARVKVLIEPAVGQPPGTTVWAVGLFVPREGM